MGYLSKYPIVCRYFIKLIGNTFQNTKLIKHNIAVILLKTIRLYFIDKSNQIYIWKIRNKSLSP